MDWYRTVCSWWLFNHQITPSGVNQGSLRIPLIKSRRKEKYNDYQL
jgi:hypothetical protein